MQQRWAVGTLTEQSVESSHQKQERHSKITNNILNDGERAVAVLSKQKLRTDAYISKLEIESTQQNMKRFKKN